MIKLLFGFLSLIAFSLFIEKLFDLPRSSVTTTVVTVSVLLLFIYLIIAAMIGAKVAHDTEDSTNDIILLCSDDISLRKNNEDNDIDSSCFRDVSTNEWLDAINIDGCFDG